MRHFFGKNLSDLIKDQSVIVNNTKYILTRPISIILYVLLMTYSYIFVGGNLYAEGFTLIKTAAFFSISIMHFLLLYLFLGHWIYAGLIRNVPAIFSLIAFIILIYAIEYTLGHLFFFRGGENLTELLMHFMAACFLIVISCMMVLATFANLIRKASSHDPDLFPLWFPLKDIPDDLNLMLPAKKRGTIIRLHSENQYVNIVTEKGSHLIRSTLTDAINRLNKNHGLQVHRSLWIRKDQIAKIFYEKGNPKIKDIHGQDYAISRKSIKKIKAVCFSD